MANLLFYVMALGAVLAAVGVVAFRTPMASVISLLGSFFCLATIYLLAGFHLLAAVQILVYAGAILVLFLFVIMLLNLADAGDLPERLDRGLMERRQLSTVLVVAGAFLAAGLFAVQGTDLGTGDPALAGVAIDDASLMAQGMFTRYLIPFEATSLLLLATAVAVLVLAKRERPDARGAEQAAAAIEPAPSTGDSDVGSRPAGASNPSNEADDAQPRELVSTGERS